MADKQDPGETDPDETDPDETDQVETDQVETDPDETETDSARADDTSGVLLFRMGKFDLPLCFMLSSVYSPHSNLF